MSEPIPCASRCCRKPSRSSLRSTNRWATLSAPKSLGHWTRGFLISSEYLRAILRRRHSPGSNEVLRFGRLEIDRGAREVRLDGQRKTMTGHQFALLLALADRAGRVLSREALMDITRGESLEDFDRSIDVHISRLRLAIEDDPKRPRRILTLRGAGYVFAKEQDR